MRLTPQQVGSITRTVSALTADRARVSLFGSRLDDSKRGGDVDLLLESDAPLGLLIRARIKMALENQLGLPVDVIEQVAGAPSTAFKELVRQDAVLLKGTE